MPAPESVEVPSGLVAGMYRLTRLLGRGGMGAVFEGVHEALGTRVAVKFIDADHAGSDEVRQRFVNEARAAARLRSKHVVQIYDQGVSEDGRPYIVMEYLEGEPLDARLDRNGTLAAAETAGIVLHVCRALAKAHEIGIVHRDLKPENVFLVHDEEDHTDIAKVVDFGIAKFTDPGGEGSSSTRTGAVLGTPQYMSPEQARGLRTVDHRADLWSLGVIVYRCLVGTLPFRGEAVGDLLVNVCTAEIPRPSSVNPSVPAGFDAWMERALAREPAARFQDAAEFCDAFAQLAGVDLRLGPVSGARAPGAPRTESGPSGALPEGTSRAVTEGSFSTPRLEVPGRSRGPGPLLLSALFVGVLTATVIVVRALSGGQQEPAGEPTAAASALATAPPPAASEEPPPPTVSPAAAPSGAPDVLPARPAPSERPKPPSRPAKAAGARGAGGAPNGKAPPRTSGPAPAKPDLLGY